LSYASTISSNISNFTQFNYLQQPNREVKSQKLLFVKLFFHLILRKFSFIFTKDICRKNINFCIFFFPRISRETGLVTCLL